MLEIKETRCFTQILKLFDEIQHVNFTFEHNQLKLKNIFREMTSLTFVTFLQLYLL